MALTDYAEYVAKVTAPYQRLQDTKNALTTTIGRACSLWVTAPFGGAIPTTAAVPNNTTTGAMGQADSSGVQRLAQVAVSLEQSAHLVIADRLSHQGGLSATVTTAQTTNLPTSALTRYTDGVGVFAAIEIYTQIGTTATTVTATYTNSGGTGSRVTPLTQIGASGYREAGRLIILPLQEGDSGVKSVESVTVASTTGTAGAFGVTLFKPLVALPIPGNGGQQLLFDSIQSGGGVMPVIPNGACLFYIAIGNLTSTGILLNALRFIEE